MATETGVFIIESLHIEEEKNRVREGKILTEILNLLNYVSHTRVFRTEYRYIRTVKELDIMIKQFKQSNLRYLHIS